MAAPTVRALGARSSADTLATTLVIAKPAGTASGDILIGALAFTGLADAATLTHPTGWVELSRRGAFMTGQQTQIVWVYKLAGGSEGASYTFTASASCYSSGFIAALSGATTPEAFAAADAAVSTNLITNPTVTCLGDERIVFYHSICNTNTAVTSHTPPAGFTELGEDFQSLAATGARRSFGWKQFATGATGTSTTTMSATVGDSKMGATIAVPPGAGGGGGGGATPAILTCKAGAQAVDPDDYCALVDAVVALGGNVAMRKSGSGQVSPPDFNAVVDAVVTLGGAVSTRKAGSSVVDPASFNAVVDAVKLLGAP